MSFRGHLPGGGAEPGGIFGANGGPRDLHPVRQVFQLLPHEGAGAPVKDMQENYRLIEALESAGWTAQEIIDLIKYVASGEEQYKPKGEK